MKAIVLTWPSGEPVRAGELKVGSWVTVELATGIVRKPKRRQKEVMQMRRIEDAREDDEDPEDAEIKARGGP